MEIATAVEHPRSLRDLTPSEVSSVVGASPWDGVFEANVYSTFYNAYPYANALYQAILAEYNNGHPEYYDVMMQNYRTVSFMHWVLAGEYHDWWVENGDQYN